MGKGTVFYEYAHNTGTVRSCNRVAHTASPAGTSEKIAPHFSVGNRRQTKPAAIFPRMRDMRSMNLVRGINLGNAAN